MDQVKSFPHLGTWAFLKSGWWVVHVISIILFGYLGYYFFRNIIY